MGLEGVILLPFLEVQKIPPTSARFSPPQDPYPGFGAPLSFLLCIAWGIGLHSHLCLPRGCQQVTLGNWAQGLGSVGTES